MLFTELMPTIRELPRADDAPLLLAGAEYPIYTPLHAYDAADALLALLGRSNQK
jgi:hypothetical protein